MTKKFAVISYGVSNGYVTKDVEIVGKSYVFNDVAFDCLKIAVHGEIEKLLGKNEDFRVIHTSSERYTDAWGYGNNGVLIINDVEQLQYEVIEENDLQAIKNNLYKLYK